MGSSTGDKLSHIVISIDKRVEALQALLHKDKASGCQTPTSPSKWSVRRNIATKEVLLRIGEARDFIDGILKQEANNSNRPILHSLFDDCLVVSRIHAVIDFALNVLQRSDLRNDLRLQGARKACEAVEGVLKESGLAQRLANARNAAHLDISHELPETSREDPLHSTNVSRVALDKEVSRDVEDVSPKISAPSRSTSDKDVDAAAEDDISSKMSALPPVAPDKDVRVAVENDISQEEFAPSRAVLDEDVGEAAEDDVSPKMSETSSLVRQASNIKFDRRKMWNNVDAAETDGEVAHAINILFDSYDKYGSGKLEDASFDECIDDIIRHIHMEAEEVGDKHGVKKLLPSRDALRHWVLQQVDPNMTGAITFDSAMRGFKAVVDDIEVGEEYQTKRRSTINSLSSTLFGSQVSLDSMVDSDN